MTVRGEFQIPKHFLAGADLSTKQYYFVENPAGVTVANAVTDVPVGVLQDKPDAAGEDAEVCIFGFTKLVAGGNVAAGDLISTTTAGKAVTLVVGTDTTAYILGRALTASTGDGQVIEAFINCMTPSRAT
jgi:hypothetical protein